MHDDAKVYLPYESTSNTTAVQENNPLLSQSAYYASLFGNDNGAYAYNENTYEASSLNRITAQWESGSNHRQEDKKTTITYGTNASEEVLLLTVDASANTLAVAGTYNSGTLHKTTTIDADSSIAVVYKDFDGRTVLERTMDAEQAHDTYHVYDTYGNLRWVITPQGSSSLSAGTTYTTESTLAKRYCYIYSYDGMGNITQKRLPGREPEYYVYDKGGRMVLYQDGNLRSSNRWIHTTWDNLNREVEKNIIATTLSREELHNSYNNTGHSNLYYYEYGGYNPNLPMPEDDYTFGNNIYSSRYYGYQYQPILSSVTHQQSIDVMDGVYLMAHAYLDIPSFMQLSLYDSGGIYIGADDMIRDEYLIYTDEVGLEYYYIPQGYMDIIETMMQEDPAASLELIYEFPGDNVPATSVTLTGGLYYENAPTANLPFRSNALYSSSDLDTLHNTGLLQYERYLLLQHDTCTVPSYKETAHYYNSRSQLIQSVTKYPHSDSLHRMSYSYTFTGAPQSTIEEYNGITKRTDYTYDERCRLISETTTINDSAPATITYSYDALGKLISKTYGNGVTETTDYNIQGWQTDIVVTNGNSNIYSQQLKYYNPTKGSTPLYTGNISEWSTTMGTQAMNTYGFEYDKLGRLKNTLHYSAAATTPTNSYTERGITYDLNGNITTLKRYAASEATPEDDYQYIYTGNKLMQITGTENNADISNALYVYDQNGNLTHDGLKNLQLSYNLLNLPEVVSQSSAEIAKYNWFADGSKYRVLDESNNGYYYIGSLIYASNSGNLQIESTDFAGGRINLVENTLTNTLSQDIQYHHKDHLGSVRAITDNSGSVIEQNAYYPFGSRHTFGNTYAQTTNRFKFNGKEEQTTGNLNYLDYGARMYDSNIARWTTQDPLAEKYYSQSPYNYCVNNPVMFVDPDGRKIEISTNFWDKVLGLIGFNNYKKQVQKDIDQLKSMDSQLNNVIEELEKSRFTIRIKHTDEREDNKNNKDNKKNNGNAFIRKYNLGKNVPMGGTLYYDPENFTTNKGNTRNPIIGLAHELGHAYNAIEGTYKLYDMKEVNKGNQHHINNLNENEKFSIFLENIIREFLEMPQRPEKYYE